MSPRAVEGGTGSWWGLGDGGCSHGIARLSQTGRGGCGTAVSVHRGVPISGATLGGIQGPLSPPASFTGPHLQGTSAAGVLPGAGAPPTIASYSRVGRADGFMGVGRAEGDGSGKVQPLITLLPAPQPSQHACPAVQLLSSPILHPPFPPTRCLYPPEPASPCPPQPQLPALLRCLRVGDQDGARLRAPWGPGWPPSLPSRPWGHWQYGGRCWQSNLRRAARG